MDIIKQIQQLRKKKKAIILVHNYQPSEIQAIADYTGDSLGLSIQAAKTPAEIILFCGVYFMAETAKILSPGKIVLLPDRAAGCPMAEMITAEQLRKLKNEYPRAKVLCYVNTSAEVKAESDFCCTSANAVTMVRKALKDAPEIIFVPDKNLADYTAGQTGRSLISWPGYCPTHLEIRPEDIQQQRSAHPRAKIIVHPECRPEVVKLSDKVLSTEGMCRFARESDAQEIVIGTETGILYRLEKENPTKKFYPASNLSVCPNMKMTTLTKVRRSLEELTTEVIVRPDIAERARQSIQRMLDFRD